MAGEPLIVEADVKHAGERKRRGFDITVFCASIWTPGQILPLGFAVRPLPRQFGGLRGTDGFQYVTQQQGQTGEREPLWGPDPIIDGSLTWLRQPLSNASLFRRVTAPADVTWLFPAAMTVDDKQCVNDIQIAIAAFHAGGTEGEIHRVIARVPFTDGTREDFAIDWTIEDDQLLV